MVVENSILNIVDNKICINGKTFEHTELREAKEYLQSINATEVLFYPKNEKEMEQLNTIITKMKEISPKISADDATPFFLRVRVCPK